MGEVATSPLLAYLWVADSSDIEGLYSDFQKSSRYRSGVFDVGAHGEEVDTRMSLISLDHQHVSSTRNRISQLTRLFYRVFEDSRHVAVERKRVRIFCSDSSAKFLG